MSSAQIPLFPEAAPALTLRDVADAVRRARLDGLRRRHRAGRPGALSGGAVRSGLARTQGMPFKWALNPYRGCTHACEYCYARKYQRHLELGTGDDFSSVIFVKRNLPEVLRRELTRPGWARESVAVGTATDPYQPIEGHYRITRRCLEVLVETRTPFSIVTRRGRWSCATRICWWKRHGTPSCQVYLSVPSVDEDAWARLEPGTAPPRQRLRAVRQLADAGVDAAVLMMPLVPGITTSRAIVRRTPGSARADRRPSSPGPA